MKGDAEARYRSFDKESVMSSDRQIDVDVPRCHQYDELLSSSLGHSKMKRVIKAWLRAHSDCSADNAALIGRSSAQRPPPLVYWQGLDSLAAPFVRLHFTDEALAFACLDAFIDRYLHNMFLKDNSKVIQGVLLRLLSLSLTHSSPLSNLLDTVTNYTVLIT